MKVDCATFGLGLLAVAVLFGGCMTSYTEPPKTASHATIAVDLLPSDDADVREVRATLREVDGIPVRWVRSRYRLTPGQRTLVWETVTIRQVHTSSLLNLMLDIKGVEVNEPDDLRAYTSFVTNTVFVETEGVYFFDGQETRRLR